MNLKAAARRLEVHYQTVYKWVRAGELTAVKVGARYEVSEAAIAQFVANRESLTAEHVTSGPARRLTDLTTDQVLEALEAMAMEPIVAGPSVAGFAARHSAEVLGDLCLVVLMNRDDLHVDHAVVGHAELDRAAFINALIGTRGERPTMGRNPASVAFFLGHTVRVSHVPQDLLRNALLPSLRQYLERYSVYSLVSAPIMDRGAPAGFIAFSRDSPGRPYSAEDEEFATRVGNRIGRLIQTEREISLAWKVGDELGEDLRVQIAGRGGAHRAKTAEFNQLLREHADTVELPVAIIGADGRFVVANDRLLSGTGYSLDAIVGQGFDVFTHPDDRVWERRGFARLVSGELDFHDLNARWVLPDGTVAGYSVHRLAVRDPDATLECVVGIGRPLHLPTNRLQPIGPA